MVCTVVLPLDVVVGQPCFRAVSLAIEGMIAAHKAKPREKSDKSTVIEELSLIGG